MTPVKIFLVALLPAILYATTFAGCIGFGGDAGPCEKIGFPGPDTMVHRRVDYPGKVARSTIHKNSSVWGPVQVMAGDGTLQEAIAITTGYTTDYVSVASGDSIAVELATGTGIHRLNDATSIGQLFFGRCLAAGDQWYASHRVPGEGFEVTVLEASPDRVEARVVKFPREWQIYGNGTVAGSVKHFIWTDSRGFANEVRNMDMPGDADSRVRSISRLIDQSFVEIDTQPHRTFEPVGQPVQVERWVEMEIPWAQYDQQSVIADLEARPVVSNYLEAHPQAYTSWVKFEVVEEQESRAEWWSVMLRDDSREALLVELVYRCFDNPAHQAVYGPCHVNERYFGPPGGPPEALGGGDDPRVNVTPMPLPEDLESVSLANILQISDGFMAGEVPSRLEWRAHPFEMPERYFGATPGRTGWLVYYGDIHGEMTMTSRGPYGTVAGYQDEVRPLYLDAVGWATESHIGGSRAQMDMP